MSLIAWYPLNGNMNNYGIGDMDLTITSLPTFGNGKIGKGLVNLGGAKWTADQTASVLNNDAVSICFWLKVTDNTVRAMIFGNDGNRRFSSYQYPTANDFHWSWRKDDGSTWSNGIITGCFPDNEWVHICITFQNPVIKIYRNGVLHTTKTISTKLNNETFAEETIVTRSCAGRIVNDYRFYNHCLSEKEVKEISKALIVYYPMNYTDGLVIGRNLAQQQYGVQNSAAVTKIDDYWHYTITSTGNNNNGSQISKFHFTGFKSGETYTWSCLARGDSDECSMHVMYTNSSGAQWNSIDRKNTSLSTDWNLYSHTFTIPSNYGSGLILNFAIGRNTSSYLDIKNVKLERGSIATPYSEAPETDSFYSEQLVDCSGYGNHINIRNAIAQNDTKIGTHSFYLDSTTRTPNSTLFSVGLTFDQLTFSVWFKTSVGTGLPNLFCVGTNEGFRIRLNSANLLWSLFRVGTTYTSNYTATSINMADNNWHLATVVFDKGTLRHYVDGIKESGDINPTILDNKITIANNIVYFNQGWIGGEVFTGSECDLRIYATALSDSDIKLLYNTRVSIDNTHNIYANQFIEGTGSSFGRNGVVTSPFLQESGDTLPDLHDMEIKREEDGALFAKIFWHDNQAKTQLFTSDAECLETTQLYKFSRLKYMEEYRMSDGKFEFILRYPDDTQQYNRWKQTANPVTVADSGSSATPAEGYEPIHIDWTGNNFGGLLKSSYNGTFIDGSTNHSNWFYAIGCKWTYGNGIPSYGSTAGMVELWVRIDTELLYDMQLREESDGSKWARIFYHNNHGATKMFTNTRDFISQPVIIDEDRYSRLNLISRFRGKNGYEFMARQPDDGNGVWRWILTNNPTQERAAGTVTSISGYQCDTKGLMLCSGATWLAHSISTGDWWCAVGAYNSFQGGLPGWGGVAVKGGLELWIRYDNVSNNIAQIYSNKLIAKEIIEL